MTYAEIKNNYTTVEEIDIRLVEIENLYKEKDNQRNELVKKNEEIFTSFLQTILPNSVVESFDTEYVTISLKDNEGNRVPGSNIEIFYGEEYDYKNDKNDWKFNLNIASVGSFNPTDTTSRAYYYYMANFVIIQNANEIDKLLKTTWNEYNELKKEYRDIHSEEKQLDILKKNLLKDNESTNYAKVAKETEDKDMCVIIDKNVDPSKATATHRKTPCIICSNPEPLENWKDMDKRCRVMMRNYPSSKFIATRIKFINFNE